MDREDWEEMGFEYGLGNEPDQMTIEEYEAEFGADEDYED